MRKFWAIIFVALMAALVLSLGGCGGSDSSDLNTTTIMEPDKTIDPDNGNDDGDGDGNDNTDLTDAIEIVLNVNTATVNRTELNMNDYVWHADPDHADEYWTEGLNGTTEYDEDEYDDLVDSSKVNGVYIARDVRYMTKDIEFTSTATKDNDP